MGGEGVGQETKGLGMHGPKMGRFSYMQLLGRSGNQLGGGTM